MFGNWIYSIKICYYIIIAGIFTKHKQKQNFKCEQIKYKLNLLDCLFFCSDSARNWIRSFCTLSMFSSTDPTSSPEDFYIFFCATVDWAWRGHMACNPICILFTDGYCFQCEHEQIEVCRETAFARVAGPFLWAVCSLQCCLWLHDLAGFCSLSISTSRKLPAC